MRSGIAALIISFTNFRGRWINFVSTKKNNVFFFKRNNKLKSKLPYHGSPSLDTVSETNYETHTKKPNANFPNYVLWQSFYQKKNSKKAFIVGADGCVCVGFTHYYYFLETSFFYLKKNIFLFFFLRWSSAFFFSSFSVFTSLFPLLINDIFLHPSLLPSAVFPSFPFISPPFLFCCWELRVEGSFVCS